MHISGGGQEWPKLGVRRGSGSADAVSCFSKKPKKNSASWLFGPFFDLKFAFFGLARVSNRSSNLGEVSHPLGTVFRNRNRTFCLAGSINVVDDKSSPFRVGNRLIGVKMLQLDEKRPNKSLFRCHKSDTCKIMLTLFLLHDVFFQTS